MPDQMSPEGIGAVYGGTPDNDDPDRRLLLPAAADLTAALPSSVDVAVIGRVGRLRHCLLSGQVRGRGRRARAGRAEPRASGTNSGSFHFRSPSTS